MMCGRSYAGHKAGFTRGHRGHHAGYSNRRNHFFGLDAEKMSPTAQVVAASSVLAPVALGAVFVLSFAPQMFWLVFVFGWMVFPAFGLLARGVAGLSEARPARVTAKDGERELLGALRRHGELTPVGAASETSLSVAESDSKLRELAEGGHLDVRVRGGGIFYALWENAPGDEIRQPDSLPEAEDRVALGDRPG